MSVGGIGSAGELRELFALIGRNIAGDPPPAETAAPPRAQAAETETGDASEPPIADRHGTRDAAPTAAGPGLAGLRPPRPAAAEAASAMLAAMRAGWSASASGTEDEAALSDEASAPEPAFARPERNASRFPAAPASIGSGYAAANLAESEAGPLPREPISSAIAERRKPAELVASAGASPFTPSIVEGEPPVEGGSASAGPDFASTGAVVASAAEASRRQGLGSPRPAGFDWTRNDGSAEIAVEGDLLSAPIGEVAGLAARLADARPGLELLSLDWAVAGSVLASETPDAALLAGAQAERAGVLASFILNAAMIPGWPPPRPIENLPAGVAAFVAARPELTEAERDLVLFLSKLLHGPGLLERLLRLLERERKRSKLLAALALVLAEIEDFAATVTEELVRAEEARLAPVRAEAGRRERLSLR
ncbi:hypothetical protein [Aureimonas leprariae]|uniref:Uncharacterized protein n=1 Tax=Plantimonas leprariae TaxID=2615207 RepID=A0A7V7PL45_9HYPH|nr:hypothetical protein [Aureimonas leprariae]KAB0676865.1 hypothetical protein F6X38_20045 [Aureimonas leprariae]